MNRMNRLVLFVSVFLIHALLPAQDKWSLKGTEVLVSVNTTTFFDDNTENRIGFGVGVNFLMNPDKNFTVLTGIEYNQTGQYKYEIFEGHWCRPADWDVKMYLFSIPIGFRYSFGSEKRLLLEAVFLLIFLSNQPEKERDVGTPRIPQIA